MPESPDPEPPASPEPPSSPRLPADGRPDTPEPAAGGETSQGFPADGRPERPQPTAGGERPRHAAPEPERTGHPRRWFLAGGAAVVLAGGGGVVAALLRHRPPAAPDAPPARLLAAIDAERALIADLDATTGGTRQVRLVLTQARADHAAHLAALRGVAAGYRGATQSSRSPSSSSSPAGTPRTAAQLRAAERAAASRAAADAIALDGRLATLFASIAACESTHAELLR